MKNKERGDSSDLKYRADCDALDEEIELPSRDSEALRLLVPRNERPRGEARVFSNFAEGRPAVDFFHTGHCALCIHICV